MCTPTHLELLREVPLDPKEVLAAQDIVYVSGGSTPILVAGLRVLGLDDVLRDLWRRGGVVCGHSAGAHVSFRGCITDSLGPELQLFNDGLGIIDGSCVAHADLQRDSILRSALSSGSLMGPAWAIEDGAAVSFSAGATRGVSWRPDAAATVLDVQASEIHTEPLDVAPLQSSVRRGDDYHRRRSEVEPSTRPTSAIEESAEKSNAKSNQMAGSCRIQPNLPDLSTEHSLKSQRFRTTWTVGDALLIRGSGFKSQGRTTSSAFEQGTADID